jgi:hypothetical protein
MKSICIDFKWLMIAFILFNVGFNVSKSFAEDSSGSATRDSRIGILAGPFLPSSISGVREILQVSGLRLGSNTRLGNFEAEGWLANGGGVSYQSFLMNYRLNIPSDNLPVHALVGVHADYYRKANATTASSGGWQIGGGAETKIAGPLSLRSDFEYRFGPGTSLLVLVSIMWAF